MPAQPSSPPWSDRRQTRWRLLDALDLVHRGRALIVVVTLGCLAIAGLLAVLAPREYVSTVRVQLHDEVLETAARLPLLESRRVVNEILFATPTPETVAGALRALANVVSGTSERELARTRSLASQKLDWRMDGEWLHVGVRAPSPEMAALLAAAFAREMEHRAAETHRGAITSTRAFLEARASNVLAAEPGERVTLDGDQRIADAVERLSSATALVALAEIDLHVASVALRSSEYELQYVVGLASGESAQRQLAESHLQSLREQLEQLAGMRASLTREHDLAREHMRRLAGDSGDAYLHVAEARAASKLSAELAERIREARRAERSPHGMAFVVAPALEPTRPASPRTSRVLGWALVVGLLLGLVAAAFRHRIDSVIYTPRCLHLSGIPLLGVVPRLDGGGHGRGGFAANAAPTEAFRRLLVRVRASLRNVSSPAILLSAAEPQAGTSTMALQLAREAAREGLRTLLIDANLAHPTVRYSLPPSHEIRELTEGRFVIWKTSIAGLTALTPRDAEVHPDLLWTHDTTRRLMVHLRGAFDLIIVDSSPVLQSADAGLLALHCDAALLIARAGQTRDDRLVAAAAELQASGITQLGVLLNGFDPRHGFGYDRAFEDSSYQVLTLPPNQHATLPRIGSRFTPTS